MKVVWFWFFLVAVLAALLWNSVANGATYCLQANGTAVNKAAAEDGVCGDASTCMTFTVHDGQTYSAGDDFMLCDDGGNFNEDLDPPSNGSSGNNIVYRPGSGEHPVIDGQGVRNYGIYCGGKSYLTFDGIEVKNAVLQGISLAWEAIPGASHHITVMNCTVHGNGTHGVATLNETGGSLITGNTIYDNRNSGVNVYVTALTPSEGDETVISMNTIYGNDIYGIELRSRWHIVEYNLVYENGTDGSTGCGIHLYSGGVAEPSSDYNIVRYNMSRDNVGDTTDGCGFGVDQWCNDNQVYNNVGYGNETHGIFIYDAANNKIYNNTFYGNSQDNPLIPAEVYVLGALSDGNELKNNIAQATVAGAYAIYFKADADDFLIAGTTSLDTNLWYSASANWYYVNDAGGNNLAAWNGIAGVGSDFNDDPLFENAAGGIFSLSAGSPAIDTGTILGSAYDDALDFASCVWPNGIVLLDQDVYGTFWEIGAAVYPVSGTVCPDPVF